MCKPNCADLPKTPQNNNKEITVTTLKSKPKKLKVLSITIGVSAKVVA
jgi:hypothetical protein